MTCDMHFLDRCHFGSHVRAKSLTGPLLLVSFCAGVLDTTAYFNFGTFASNQTGWVCIEVAVTDDLQEHPHSHFSTVRSPSRLNRRSLDRRLSIGFPCFWLCVRANNDQKRLEAPTRVAHIIPYLPKHSPPPASGVRFWTFRGRAQSMGLHHYSIIGCQRRRAGGHGEH